MRASSPARFIWVTEDASRSGGVEAVLRNLDTGLAARGVETRVRSWAATTRRSSRDDSCAWLRDAFRSAYSRRAAARAEAAHLRREIAEDPGLVVVLDTGSMDVARHLVGAPRWGIHVHWTPDLVLRPWRHLGGEKIPVAARFAVHLRMRWTGWANRRLLRAAPFLVSLTSSHTRTFAALQRKVYEIRNPISCGPIVRRDFVNGRRGTVGYVGRLSWEKGPDLLVEALAAMAPELRPERTLVAGVGPMADEIRTAVARHGLSDVDLLGWVEPPRIVLDETDVLVLPSRAEAVPLVIVEALAAGCYVVAADAGEGVRDLLDGGRLGSIVPAEDPVALARAIEKALADLRTGGTEDAIAIADLVASHDPDAVLDRWQRLLLDLTRLGDA